MVKLISCKSCKNPVSLRANSCPNCGYEQEKGRKESRDLKMTIFWSILILLFLWIGGLQKISNLVTAFLTQAFNG